jgi:Helix-turn-helix domain
MRGHNRIAVQNALILDHLRTRPITPIEALRLYGCFRLGARIFDLRQMGHEILTTRVINDYGNPYAEYHLLRLAPREAA